MEKEITKEQKLGTIDITVDGQELSIHWTGKKEDIKFLKYPGVLIKEISWNEGEATTVTNTPSVIYPYQTAIVSKY